MHEDLDELGREFVKLNRILGPFLELSTGTREPIRIRSIASSAFEAFLHSAPATALILATAIERLISSYEKVMNIRLAHQKLKEAGASQKTLDSAEADAEATMGRDIKVIVEELLAEAPELEQGRANELRTELEQSLNALANRMTAGIRSRFAPASCPRRRRTKTSATRSRRLDQRLRQFCPSRSGSNSRT